MTLHTDIKSVSLTKSEFITVSNVPLLAEILERADYNTLVVFDVDMVLLHSKEPAFQMPNLLHHYSLIAEVMADLNLEEKDLLLHYPLIEGEAETLDSEIPMMILQLQARHIQTIACTAILSGSIAPEPDMMAWRIKQLAHLGMDFSRTAPNSIAFQSIQFPTYRGNAPQYQDGVLITNGEHGPVHKGDALVALLKTMPMQPNQIIMIDDRLKNLENVNNSLAEIAFEGSYTAIEFTAAHYHNCPLVSDVTFAQSLQRFLSNAKTEMNSFS